ncbi:MAG: SurA N-terminal domain-containing protein [Pseudomonadota bacterium]
MLQDIRDRASSWVAYIIIGLLILSFALWGIQEYFGGGAGLPVANVNGTEITQPQLNQRVQERKQMLQSILGANYQQQYPNDDILRQQVIQDMVRTELLRQEVDAAGFKISDASLVKRIQQIPQFQTDGKFDPALYKRILDSQRLNQAQWENELRQEDKLRQFESAMAASSFIPKVELQRFQKISEQTRDFKYAVVPVNQEGVEISDTEVESYYNENKHLFQTQEQIKLSYIELKEQDISDSTNFSAEEAKDLYESQLERYMSPELRKVSHIMFKVPSEVGEDAIEWDTAMEKAQDIVKQLKDGANFSELASQHSEDTLSADKGGDIGFIAPGDFTNKDLEDALFSLDIDGISRPVKTEQGVQVLKLTEIQAPEQEPFESVREKIINEQKSQIAQQRFIEVADELANIVVEQPDELPEVAADFDFSAKQTEFLATANNNGIFAFPKVKNIAFSNDVLEEKLNSDLIEVADGHVLVVRVEEHKKAEQRPIESVQDDIKNLLTVRKAAENTTKLGSELFLKLKGGTSLESIASENNLEIISHGAVRRDDNRVPGEISQRAFTIEKPSAGNASADGVSQGDGTFALIELSEVNYGSEEVDATKMQQLSQRVNYGRREFSAVIDAIQESGDVTIFQEQVVAEQ